MKTYLENNYNKIKKAHLLTQYHDYNKAIVGTIYIVNSSSTKKNPWVPQWHSKYIMVWYMYEAK